MTRSQLEGIIRTKLENHSAKHGTSIIATEELVTQIADGIEKESRQPAQEKMQAGIELGFVWD